MKPIIVVTSTRTVQREDVEIRHYPFIDIVPIKFEQSCLKPHYDWLIFTSVNAIKIFEPYLNQIEVDCIAVIGTKQKSSRSIQYSSRFNARFIYSRRLIT